MKDQGIAGFRLQISGIRSGMEGEIRGDKLQDHNTKKVIEKDKNQQPYGVWQYAEFSKVKPSK